MGLGNVFGVEPVGVRPPEFLPELAIIIPVWKQPEFLHDSVTSALAQRAAFPIAVVIVNDGCPFEDTDRVGRMLARAHPEVFYLRQPNRGLSGARNAGVAFALSRWPDLRAIFPLDADNLLRPHAMAHALAALDQAQVEQPDIGWIYPNIDMFGEPLSIDHGGPYSVLLHTQLNICEAGSLIARAVFEAGVRYDETMRQGWEDWEFWLSAVEAGFRGQHLRDFGFCYRRRAESMLTQTATMEAHLYQGLVARHKALFSPRNLLALECSEAPRFACVKGDQVTLFTDPAHPVEQLTLSDFARRVRAGKTHMTRSNLPVFVLSLPEETAQDKTVYSILWHMERDARRVGLARQGQAVMMRLDMLGGSAVPGVFADLALASAGHRPHANWDWRGPGLPWRLQMQEIPRRHVGGAVLSARCPDDLPCVVLQGHPDGAGLEAIEHFTAGGPFHLALLDRDAPVAPLAKAARTITHLPADDPTACAGFLAGMARILIVRPVVDAELLSALKQVGPQLWLYVHQGTRDAAGISAGISHVVTGMIAADHQTTIALMAEGVSASMIDTVAIDTVKIDTVEQDP